MFATTKLVRKIVRSINNGSVYGYSYTDKCKRVENLRNVTFFIDAHKAEQVKRQLQYTLFALGYENAVKVTTSKEHSSGFVRGGGNTYLRINNCVLD
jgi:hypothetical protein